MKSIFHHSKFIRGFFGCPWSTFCLQRQQRIPCCCIQITNSYGCNFISSLCSQHVPFSGIKHDKLGRSHCMYHSHLDGPEIEIQADTFNSPDKTKKFVKKLHGKQRTILLNELQRLNREQNTLLNDDPILLQPPSRHQLNHVVLNNAVPFIGFGFLDNAIMIIAGDYIDWRIGAVLGISTLAAAGLGNLISDLAGVVLAGYVEAFAARLGLKSPNLSLEQYDMTSSKLAAALGRCIGIVIGCVLGLFPLLFLNTEPRVPASESDDASQSETSLYDASQSETSL